MFLSSLKKTTNKIEEFKQIIERSKVDDEDLVTAGQKKEEK